VEAGLSRGGTVSAEGPGGRRPALLHPLSLSDDGRQQVLVSQQGGGSDDLSLFALVASERGMLVLLDEPPVPVLGSGFDRSGRAFRWAADAGRLFTVSALGPPRRTGTEPVEAWEWQVRRSDVVPRPLGKQCLKPGSHLPEPC
jgi:hypothetical protein